MRWKDPSLKKLAVLGISVDGIKKNVAVTADVSKKEKVVREGTMGSVNKRARGVRDAVVRRQDHFHGQIAKSLLVMVALTKNNVVRMANVSQKETNVQRSIVAVQDPKCSNSYR